MNSWRVWKYYKEPCHKKLRSFLTNLRETAFSFELSKRLSNVHHHGPTNHQGSVADVLATARQIFHQLSQVSPRTDWCGMHQITKKMNSTGYYQDLTQVTDPVRPYVLLCNSWRCYFCGGGDFQLVVIFLWWWWDLMAGCQKHTQWQKATILERTPASEWWWQLWFIKMMTMMMVMVAIMMMVL